MNLRELEEAGIRHYQRIGALNGELRDEPDYCFYCGDVLDGEDPCACLPEEPPVEEYDIRGDR
jgi:hypothetical protein